MTGGFYGEDLARVHDAAFGAIAEEGAATLVRLLRRGGHAGGLVVELGCGSGVTARRLLDAGYDVLGVDASDDLLALARARAPQARFTHGSLWDADLPPCVAVAALGEVVSYCHDPRAGRPATAALLRRVTDALEPGGLLLFDAVEPGRGSHRTWHEGQGWLLAFESSEDAATGRLRRRMTIFRDAGGAYARTDEAHEVWLYRREDALTDCAAAGLAPRLLRGYGPRVRFRRGHFGVAAVRT